MWQKLGKIYVAITSIIGTLTLLVVAAWVIKDIRATRAYARQQAEDRIAYAYAARLRADGDRLAKAGEWEDALARYEQSEGYDRRFDDDQKQKLEVIEEHVGAVVWDKEFEAAHGRSP